MAQSVKTAKQLDKSCKKLSRWRGFLCRAGLVVIDPESATIFDGRVTFKYNPSYLEIGSFGWLGEFGADPTIPAPPVNQDFDYNDVVFQSPNQNLQKAEVVDNFEKGVFQVDFSWGSNGFKPASEHFNYFAFEIISPLTYDFVTVPHGTGKLTQLLGDVDEGVNASTFVTCIPAGEDEIQLCGNDELPPDIDIIPVPEPNNMLGIGIALGFGTVLKKNYSRKRKIEKAI
ncbi:PEP-CTERM sorting domain-containing protein [Aliinostoc sp. HNIBRCY26]|uniref:PEP-CTERM sorting domain-containing protein n=1 Tax=Aliinostoc sp. HNIBRCY26 TaxID=3418997 RepID=UPI003D0084AA